MNTSSTQDQDKTKSDSRLQPAQLMADVVLGAANNIIEVGGGFIVKIKPHQNLHEYEELIQILDEQNQRNVRRLRLEESDQALLRPLLAAVLAKHGAVLSPEHQLLIAVFSILIKKAQMVMQIRTENKLLLSRIQHLIREEAAASAQVDSELEQVLSENGIAAPEIRSDKDSDQESLNESDSESPNQTEAEEQDPLENQLLSDQESEQVKTESAPIKTEPETPLNLTESESDEDFEAEMQALREARDAELKGREEAGEELIQSPELEESADSNEAENVLQPRPETRAERRRREREEKKLQAKSKS